MADHSSKLGRNPFGTGSIAVLAEASGSPSMIRMRQELAKKFPQMQWHEWEPIDGDAGQAGIKLAFGVPHAAQPVLDKAEVVVCLDADPLNGAPPRPDSPRLGDPSSTRGVRSLRSDPEPRLCGRRRVLGHRDERRRSPAGASERRRRGRGGDRPGRCRNRRSRSLASSTPARGGRRGDPRR